MKTAAIINRDYSVDVILYDDRDKVVRKIHVTPDGQVSFRDFGDASVGMEFILLKAAEGR